MTYSFECPECGNSRPLLNECGQCGSFEIPILLSDTVEFNLKRGGPTGEEALDKLTTYLRRASEVGIKAIILIHGYGSSGEGGAIKTAVLRQLQFLSHQGRVKAIIPGEEFEGRSNRGRQLLRRFPFLVNHRDLNRANPGVTLVIL